jgi:hypothetical protein
MKHVVLAVLLVLCVSLAIINVAMLATNMASNPMLTMAATIVCMFGAVANAFVLGQIT